MHDITISDVEYIAFSLARQLLNFDEPIPDYSTRFPNTLESCLATPFQWFGGRSLYRGLISKASLLFYLMIKNHPFQNGNKRIAITTLFVFLYFNGKWMHIDNWQIFYDFSIRVAASLPSERGKILIEIRNFIRGYIGPIALST